MAAVAFALIACGVFVGLTRLAVTAPFPVLDAVVVGLAFFVLPCLLVSPPAAVLWRRLQLQGECEHLRWLIPPAATPARPPAGPPHPLRLP